MSRFSLLLALLVLLAGLPACGSERDANASVPPPIADCDDAFAAALSTPLAPAAPLEVEGIDNVFRLSPSIVSGAEPTGPAALERLAAMGIKTVLSVDGKAPDVTTARALGMRYVHVPIQYTGVTRAELLRIAKTFRELPKPMFVHCFHGRHRGPAAAAVGRVLIDGVSREQAIAEMRQWCGTAGKYQGLYDAVATGNLPTVEETKQLDWGFDEVKRVSGVRAGMVRLTRSFDHVKALSKLDFAVDPDHPDLDAVNEATQVVQLLRDTNAIDDPRVKRKDYAEWMDQSLEHGDALIAALRDVRANEDGALERANRHLRVVKNLCSTCHHVYRNNRW